LAPGVFGEQASLSCSCSQVSRAIGRSAGRTAPCGVHCGDDGGGKTILVTVYLTQLVNVASVGYPRKCGPRAAKCPRPQLADSRPPPTDCGRQLRVPVRTPHRVSRGGNSRPKPDIGFVYIGGRSARESASAPDVMSARRARNLLLNPADARCDTPGTTAALSVEP